MYCQVTVFKKAFKEHIQTTHDDITFVRFLTEVLNYSDEDAIFITRANQKATTHKHKHNKNKHPVSSKNVGDKENPEYEKYYNMVLSFRKYLYTKGNKPEDGGKKTLRTFMKYAYGLEGDDATKEMRKIENIVNKGKKSPKSKVNKKRAKREQLFNEKFNL